MTTEYVHVQYPKHEMVYSMVTLCKCMLLIIILPITSGSVL